MGRLQDRGDAVTWVDILSPILAAGAVWCVVSAATEPEDDGEDEEAP
jgi:hypothetical protein